ncbi:hypothetical protein MIMGU_mgv1a026604mg [Erythranthe guttata]|uniref:Protein POLYCHOME n=1 Tax=Erythranthe guttata TaxID=4155 RepID=A0A022RIT6_ERYGU|nr:hypothetical protein MIMGU_mgv1a026604mg [Erythranthe guttata]
MPERRDGMPRQEDVIATYSNRRPIFSSGGRDCGRVNSLGLVLEDEPKEGVATETPFRWRGTGTAATPGPIGIASGRGSIVNPRIGITGKENLSPMAIERRRALCEESEGLQNEHDFLTISQNPKIGKVPKILLLNITNQDEGDSVSLTPQKKLLNDIDTVEKVVTEELRKLKSTPTAKKAERDKRVRTLLSMR